MTTEHHDSASKRLVALAQQIAVRERLKLAGLKTEHAQLNRPDFLWHYLLQSFATMGRAAGWHGLIGNRQNYDALKFDLLAGMSPTQRSAHVGTICRRAGIRMPDKKAEFICGSFKAIEGMGGPEAARNRLLTLPGREAKIEFLKQLPGIGDKYARNIMMDVYHEDFRDSIAIDARIEGISAACGLEFARYEEHERFWLGVAHEAGLEGWELDRLMFHFQKEFLPTDTSPRPDSNPRSAQIASRASPSLVNSSVMKKRKADGYVQVKTTFCKSFPFAGLGALGMWYGDVVAVEIPKWQHDVRTAVMGDAADKVALCFRFDGYQLRRIRTDGRLLQVYDRKTGALLTDSLLPTALLGENLKILDPAEVPSHLLRLGGFAAEFAVDGMTHKGWLLLGKSYSAAWTENGRALHFEMDGSKNPNGRVLRRLST